MAGPSRGREILLMVLSLGVLSLVLEGAVRIWPASSGRYPFLDRGIDEGPFNSLGYRDTEHERTPAPGTHRVLFLGDSFTFGTGVLFDDVFPRRVERGLARSRKESWESVVVAKPGLNTTDELRLLEQDGVALRPDVLVVGYVLNDPETPDWGEHRRAEEWHQKARGGPPWWFRSALLRLVGRRLVAARESRARLRNYHSLFADGAPGFIQSKQALSRIGELVKERNLPWIVAIFPLLGNPLDETYPFFEETRKVKEAARAAGAVPLDLFEHYRGMEWTLLVVNGSDNEHPNEIGHRIAAQAIAEAIDSLVPRASVQAPASAR